MNKWFFLLATSFFFKISLAQNDSMNIYDLNLSQLSKLKISSVSKTNENINEIASTIYIITSADIIKNNYFTLDEALADLPGFQFRNILGINSYIFQRGVPNQNNLILLLIDGVQINELNSGGFYGGAQYNLLNVERIEVIYGPSSVAYGTNAVSGIINIITKNANANSHEFSLLAGNFDTFKGNFVTSKKFKNIDGGILVAGMINHSKKANLKGAAGDYNWTDLLNNFEKNYSFDFKFQANDFTFGTNCIYKEASTATLIKSVGTTYKDYGTSWNILFANNYLKYYKKINEKITNSTIVYNRNTSVLNNTIYYVLDTAQVGYYRPNNLSGIEQIINYDFSKQFAITSGLNYEYEQISQAASFSYSDSSIFKPPRPTKPSMLKNSLASVFVEPRINFFKNLFLSGGARFDYSTVYQKVLSPRFGIIYHYKKHAFRISYAEAFRAPRPWDYTDGLGNKDLLPEKMKSHEAAFTISATNKLKFDLIGYLNHFENAINKEILPTGFRWINDGKINTTGLEFNMNYISKKIKSTINYTYNNSLDDFKIKIPEISEHVANASIIYSIIEPINISLKTHYIGERKNTKIISTTNSNILEPYFLLDANLNWMHHNGLLVQFAVKNILNNKYYHPSNRMPDRYRQAQRTLSLTINYSF